MAVVVAAVLIRAGNPPENPSAVPWPGDDSVRYSRYPNAEKADIMKRILVWLIVLLLVMTACSVKTSARTEIVTELAASE